MRVVYIAALVLLVAAAVAAQRGHRTCIACRRRFPTVADRTRHERRAHQL